MQPLSPDELAAALSAAKTALVAKLGDRLERTVLFGSYATGRVHEESDVDVLVVVRSRGPDDRTLVAEAAADTMMRHPRAVLGMLVLTPEELQDLADRERRIARDIARDGIPF